VGERSGARWPLGMTVTVKLVEATPVTGGLLFGMVSEPLAADPTAPRPRLGMRARGDRRPGGPAGFRGPKRGPQGRPKNIRTGKKGGPRR
jgi:ribonuclease R